MEDALLKSTSLFPYFILVAFEAGGLLRAILLFLAYPLVCLLSKEMGIKILVFICFFGIKKDKFRVGRSVLPKFFLEDVGYQGFEVVMRHMRKVGLSDLPTIMVEGFLKDYLGVDVVMGRELKVAYGYFVGFMEERRNSNAFLNEIIGQDKINSLVGFKSFGTTFSQQFFSHCKSHGCLIAALWNSVPNSGLYSSHIQCKQNSEILSPIRTVRLMRDTENDFKMMKDILCQGDLVLCPEGTTCREPYLLRFSPLFAELTDDIIPVALDMQVSMFYGTTASGLKCLDPLFFLLNPSPTYTVRFLERLPTSYSCGSGGKSRYEVANYVQSEIGEALGYECTSLTRKEKYTILAGNEGVI
ncbi:hypothetical protein ACH5RR_022827 [Cinchona calisaya]|uniref:Glycerol-3-phosphate acyltransferase RAM2/GPAT1-8 HAD-like domain-containing protein n=1 Tax=Cinchona calisaya TaxID=153742 RepID=A0ABD2ZCB0_9GENT